MGKQLNYQMTYDTFLQIAQIALNEGCLIIRNERSAKPIVPTSDLSIITPKCSKYWFYLPELAPLVIKKDISDHYYPDYSFNPLGLAMIEAGYSRFPAEQARIYVMSGYYDPDGQWIRRSEQITNVYNRLAQAIRKSDAQVF